MHKTSRIFITIGGILGALGIIIGAFGAHAIKGSVSESLYDGFLTGARYHLIHAVFLIVLGILRDRMDRAPLLTLAGYFTLAGVLCFSGSLYIMALTPLRPGLLTPFGGLLLIAAWGLMVIQFLKKQHT